MQTSRRIIVRALVPLVAIALLATACGSSGSSSRGASGSLGDPTQVSALAAGPQVPEGSPAAPVFPGAVVSPSNGVSTSVSPTIVATDAKGATSFDVRDLSTGTTGFHRTYSSSSNSQRIPVGAGLRDGGIYVWTATDSTGAKFGGSFQVDVEVSGVQAADTVGGVTTGLSSGEASFRWESHSLNSLPGNVGFGLQYAISNPEESGVPAGWDLRAASSSPYSHLVVREDGSVGVFGLDGATTSYRPSAGGTYTPVPLSGGLDATGTAPVLTKNADGTWTVLNKQSASTFTEAGPNGIADLVSIDTSDKPMLGQKWSDGLLRTITDPVSGRSIDFVYGGGDCGSIAAGFVSAPTNQLCRVRFWDGSTSSVQYVAMPDGSKQIGRLIDYPEAKGEGALVTDISYDSIGRVSSTRAPLANAAIAAGMADESDPTLLSTFEYDDEGRVAKVTGQSATIGGPRDVRTYQYTSVRSTTIVDANFGGPIASVQFDPATFRILSTTDTAGLTATNEYDASGQLIKRVDRNGNVTLNSYEGGRLVESRGPTEGSLASEATVTKYSYDQSFAVSADGSPIHGLDVSYWSTSDWTGRVTADEVGPRNGEILDPSLSVNWTESPTGSGQWSARMTGALVVEKEGRYSVDAGGSAKVWIESVSCAVGGCHDLPLSKGTHQIRIDVSSTSPEASMSVTWSGPDTNGSPVPIPTSALRPQYGYITTTRSNDALAAGVEAESVSRTVYEAPSKGQVASRVSQSGAVSKLGYQPLTGSDGNWGRQNSTTMPSGTVVAINYWGDSEKASSGCPSSSSAVQGGLPKNIVAEDAQGASTTSTSTYDSAGRVLAVAIAGGATTCTTYDKGGRAVRLDTLGMGRTETVVTDFGVDGNPFVTTRTATTGKVVTVSRVEIDLAGRPVANTDRNGITQTTTYDGRTGKPQRLTWTTSSGVMTNQVNTFDAQARLAKVEIDGRTAALVEYGADGIESGVVYGNGVRLDLGYDASNRNDSAVWSTTDGHRASSTRTIAPGGRLLASTISFDGVTSNWAYTYDEARHLATATLSSGLTPAHTWAYTYDANANRTAQVVDGVRTTYSYDASDRLLSSSDPAIGTLEYDELGDVTKLGADTFTYDATRAIVGATDGSTTVTYDRDATGAIVAKSTTSASGEEKVRYGIGGLTLAADGAPMLQDVPLPGGVTYTHPVGGTGTATWGLADLAGNRLLTTSDAGAVVGSVQVYEPFGTLLTSPVPPAPGQVGLTWLATSGNESQQMKVSYQLMGARVYVPAIGRFLQVDPKPGGSANAYDFADQDPVNLRDSNGQSFSQWISAIVVAVVSIALTPFTGGGSILVGAGIGLAIGAAGYVLDWGIRSAIDGQLHTFDVAQFAITAGIGALMGAAGGALGKLRQARSAAVSEDVEIAGGAQAGGGNGVAAEVIERRSMTVSEMGEELDRVTKWHQEALDRIGRKMGQRHAEMVSLRNQGLELMAQTVEARNDKLFAFYMELDAMDPAAATYAWEDGLLDGQLRAFGLMR